MEVQINVIARMRSDFPTKFGIPRQPHLVQELQSTIVFEPEYRNADALRGMEGFSHLWIIWQFSEAVRSGWSPPRDWAATPGWVSSPPAPPSGPTIWGFPV